jgi:hypothetical protein
VSTSRSTWDTGGHNPGSLAARLPGTLPAPTYVKRKRLQKAQPPNVRRCGKRGAPVSFTSFNTRRETQHSTRRQTSRSRVGCAHHPNQPRRVARPFRAWPKPRARAALSSTRAPLCASAPLRETSPRASLDSSLSALDSCPFPDLPPLRIRTAANHHLLLPPTILLTPHCIMSMIQTRR